MSTWCQFCASRYCEGFGARVALPYLQLSPAISALQLAGRRQSDAVRSHGRPYFFLHQDICSSCALIRRRFISSQDSRPHYVARPKLDPTPSVPEPTPGVGCDRLQAAPPISIQGPETMSPSSALAQASVRSICARASKERRMGGNVGLRGILFFSPVCNSVGHQSRSGSSTRPHCAAGNEGLRLSWEHHCSSGALHGEA